MKQILEDAILWIAFNFFVFGVLPISIEILDKRLSARRERKRAAKNKK